MRGLGVLSFLLGAGGLGGCTTDDDPEPRPGRASVPLEIVLVSGAGSLRAEDRTSLEEGIGDVLSAYVVQAFLGDYPRDDFVRSLDGFTSGAARAAAADLDLLTAARYDRAEGVTARRLLARLTVTVAGGDPVGATAQVLFRFRVDTERQESRRATLRGRFLLTHQDEGWEVFGYDVRREDVAAGRRAP